MLCCVNLYIFFGLKVQCYCCFSLQQYSIVGNRLRSFPNSFYFKSEYLVTIKSLLCTYIIVNCVWIIQARRTLVADVYFNYTIEYVLCTLQRETLVNLFDFYFTLFLHNTFWTTKSMYLMYVCLVSFFYLRFFSSLLYSWRTSEVAVSFNVLCYTLALSYTTYTRYEYMWCIIYFCGVYIHCLHSFCISGLFFEENAVNCVLYATKRLKRQFQNKSLLGRICKLQVSRLKYFFNLLCIMSIKGKISSFGFFLKVF